MAGKTTHETSLARWIINEGISQRGIKSLLKLPGVLESWQETNQWSLRSPRKFIAAIIRPQIPSLAQPLWAKTELEVPYLEVKVDLYYQGIIQAIRFLMIFGPFSSDLTYAPVREFNSSNQRIYSEAHTANAWWDLQGKYPPGATIIPIQLNSDKTMLSLFRGDRAVHALYMTIFNLSRQVRRQTSRPSSVLLALLPILPKKRSKRYADEAIKDEDSALYTRMVFHRAMDVVLERMY
jgi:hypothetical protein